MERHGALEAVVDASVVVKWYANEEFTEEAMLLRKALIEGSIRLYSPVLLFFEVFNALKAGKDNRQFLESAAESLAHYAITQFHPFGEYLGEIITTSVDNEISFYDASYVALAKHLNSLLYTADRVLIKRLSDDYRGFVKHISDFSAT